MLLIPICLAVSSLYSRQIVGASLSLITFTIIYNELAGHSHWFVRNLVNACGAASFEVGTTLLTCTSYSIHPVILALLMDIIHSEATR